MPPQGCDIINLMPYRQTVFVNEYFYHVFNRGSNKQPVFLAERDYRRFLDTLMYYQFSGPKPKFSTHARFKKKDYTFNQKIVDIVSYCLMPNHFHLLIKQQQDNGVIEFISKSINSYTKYFNAKHNRSGPLFQGEYKAVYIESEEQLVHVSRYIHLNPYVAGIVTIVENFPFSSYNHYLGKVFDPLCLADSVLSHFTKPGDYKSFVDDHAIYAMDLERIKHLLIDPE